MVRYECWLWLDEIIEDKSPLHVFPSKGGRHASGGHMHAVKRTFASNEPPPWCQRAVVGGARRQNAVLDSCRATRQWLTLGFLRHG